MKILNVTMMNGEAEIRIDGYIVADEDKWIYEWFGCPAVCPRDVHKVLEELNGKPLTVKINSYGGNAWSGSVIYTALKEYKGVVVVKIDGLAASAASVVAMGGDRVMISPTAQTMIHNASSTISGDYKEMEKGADWLKKVNDSISNAYILKSGMDKSTLLELMDKETWLTAQEMVEYGLADEIMFQDDIITPDVANVLKNNAQNIYSCFNMPSPESIDELKKLLTNPEQKSEGDSGDAGASAKNDALKPEQDKALALLEIEKNRY